MSKLLNPEEMTSRDYYFDSYAHFGIHEVWRPALVAKRGELGPAATASFPRAASCMLSLREISPRLKAKGLSPSWGLPR